MHSESAAGRHEAGPNGRDARPAQPTADGAAASGVARELQNFFTDIEDLVKSVTSLTGDDLVRAKAQLGVRMAEARASAEKMGGVIADRTRNTARATDNYVHAQPWQAIGVGAALGLAIGFMLARRK